MTSVQNNDPRLLDRILDDQHRRLAPHKGRDDFFTFFAADKALQERDLDTEEILDGIVDGAHDCGIDGIWSFVDGRYVTADAHQYLAPRAGTIELVVLQAKTSAGLAGAMAVTAAGVLLPWRFLSARPVVGGLLISLPVWVALLVWAVIPHAASIPLDSVPLGDMEERLTASPSVASLEELLTFSLMALLGALPVAALLAALEAADASVTVARRAVRRSITPASVTVLLLAKLTFLGLGFAGLFGAQARGEDWDRGTWHQWALATLLVTLGAAAYKAAWKRPILARHERKVSLLIVAGLGFAGLMLLTLALVMAIGGPYWAGPWYWNVYHWVHDTEAPLRKFELATFACIVGIFGLALIVRRSWSSGALLALAAFAVSFPVGLQQILAHTPTRVLISLPFIDAVVTIAALLTLLVTLVRPRMGPPPGDLLTVVVASTLICFGVERLIPDSIESGLFLAFLITPVLWRFTVDTREEMQRPARLTIFSMGAWSALLTVSSCALLLGVDRDAWSPNEHLQWKLLLIPLVFTLLCRKAEAEPRESASGWEGSSIAGRTVETRLAYTFGALGAAILALGAFMAFAQTLRMPP
ncbi:hypothetical protein ACFCXF_27700 [Streptomyces virginiae]|uniref:hypothetical protein n=1 Tax=Streptomyces virginiae TaxID=1961 RepID=UPI0035DC9C14